MSEYDEFQTPANRATDTPVPKAFDIPGTTEEKKEGDAPCLPTRSDQQLAQGAGSAAPIKFDPDRLAAEQKTKEQIAEEAADKIIGYINDVRVNGSIPNPDLYTIILSALNQLPLPTSNAATVEKEESLKPSPQDEIHRCRRCHSYHSANESCVED